MAYEGYLLKIGDYIVPSEYIKAESFSPYVNMQDVDPWTDANGYVHRTAIELKALKVEFETPAGMTRPKLNSLLSNIKKNYISEKERTFNVTAYIPEYDSYVTQKAYLADFTPVIYGIFDNVISYNSIRFAIIGGVA
jgi:hypothetical protein